MNESTKRIYICFPHAEDGWMVSTTEYLTPNVGDVIKLDNQENEEFLPDCARHITLKVERIEHRLRLHSLDSGHWQTEIYCQVVDITNTPEDTA